MSIQQRPVQMRATRKKMLNALGIDVEAYHVDRKTGVNVWGIELSRGGESLVFIEHEPTGHGGDGKYHVRERQTQGTGRSAPDLAAYPTQRQAVSAWLRSKIQRTSL